MQKIPCVVIKDLLPSYVDSLTSEETNELIRAHIEECEECRAILAAMQEPTPEPIPEAEGDRKEIDFLKKNRKRNHRIIIGSLLACVLLVAGILGLRTFVIGSPSTKGLVVCDVKVRNLETKTLTLDGTVTDSLHAISKIDIQEEEGGVIKVSTRVVAANPLHPSGDFHTEYVAEKSIQQVWLDGRIIWENGETIPQQTFDLFETRHEYIGDMSANNRLARQLQVETITGPYENELETSTEPYEWKLILLEDRNVSEEKMEAIAYCMLGLVKNLGKVTFQGPSFTKTVTVEDANAIFERNIKVCGDSVWALNQLIQKTGLLYASAADFVPDRMDISSQFSPSEVDYTEKDPSIVADFYERYQKIKLTDKRYKAMGQETRYMSITFRDSRTGQTRGFTLDGAYQLVFEDDEYYYREIEGGEELYEALCALKKE